MVINASNKQKLPRYKNAMLSLESKEELNIQLEQHLQKLTLLQEVLFQLIMLQRMVLF